MKLYSYWRSSCSWRVRIALALKELDYEYVTVDLRTGGGRQHEPGFGEVNAMRQVPTLELEVDGGTVRLSQSLAICEYLDARWPTPPLLPAEPLAAARARQQAEMINAGIQPLQNLGVTERLRERAPDLDRKAWCRDAVVAGFDALEVEMAATAGRHAVGDSPTLVDICLVPQMFNARRFDVDLARYPTLVAVEVACAEHPAFVAAHPDQQPDAHSG